MSDLTQAVIMSKRTPDSLTLESLLHNLEEAQAFLVTARARAYSLNLYGTAREISGALSNVESVLFEIDCKEQPEFAPFREPVGTVE